MMRNPSGNNLHGAARSPGVLFATFSFSLCFESHPHDLCRQFHTTVWISSSCFFRQSPLNDSTVTCVLPVDRDRGFRWESDKASLAENMGLTKLRFRCSTSSGAVCCGVAASRRSIDVLGDEGVLLWPYHSKICRAQAPQNTSIQIRCLVAPFKTLLLGCPSYDYRTTFQNQSGQYLLILSNCSATWSMTADMWTPFSFVLMNSFSGCQLFAGRVIFWKLVALLGKLHHSSKSHHNMIISLSSL